MNIAIHLHTDSKEPVYMQLYYYFKTEILTGKIEAGTKLPSIRYVASFLQISKNTVIAAYQQLWMEGYVESKEKINQFLHHTHIGHLGLVDADAPYVIPLNYVWFGNHLYFHGASEGRKNTHHQQKITKYALLSAKN